MGWICPVCGRNFRSTNQLHSCRQYDEETLFKKSSEEVRLTFARIKEKLGILPDVRYTYLNKTVIIASKSTFCAVKPKPDHLVLEFFLSEEHDEFPVFRIFRISKNRIVHYIKVQEPGDVDEQLTGWLEQSYRIINR